MHKQLPLYLVTVGGGLCVARYQRDLSSVGTFPSLTISDATHGVSYENSGALGGTITGGGTGAPFSGTAAPPAGTDVSDVSSFHGSGDPIASSCSSCTNSEGTSIDLSTLSSDSASPVQSSYLSSPSDLSGTTSQIPSSGTGTPSSITIPVTSPSQSAVTNIILGSNIIIGSNTITWDSTTRTIGTLVVGPSNIIIGASTVPLPADPALPTTVEFPGQVFTEQPSPTPSTMVKLDDISIISPIEVTIDDETYVLPRDLEEYAYVDDNGQEKKLSLSRDKIVIDGLEVKVPTDLSQPLSIPAGAPSIKFSAGEGSNHNAPSDPVGHAREALNNVRNDGLSIAESAGDFFKGIKSWIDDGFRPGASLDSVDNALNSLSGGVNKFCSGITQLAGDFAEASGAESIELDELLGDGRARNVVNAYSEVSRSRNLLSFFKKTIIQAKNLQGNLPDLVKESVKGIISLTVENPKIATFSMTGLFAGVGLIMKDSYDFEPGPPPATTSADDSPNNKTEYELPRAPHVIITYPDTTYFPWKSFIYILPDRDDNDFISDQDKLPYINGQMMVTKLNFVESKLYKLFPIVEFLSTNDAAEVIPHIPTDMEDSIDYAAQFNHTKPQKNLSKRAGGRKISRRSNAPKQLQLLSQQGLGQRNNYYVRDNREGAGSTIYMLDSGFDVSHQELWKSEAPGGPERDVEFFTVQNSIFNDPKWPVEMDRLAPEGPEDYTFPDFKAKQYTGHGGIMAAAAAGLRIGVAPKANLVLVKFCNGYLEPKRRYYEQCMGTGASIQEAFRMIRNHYQAQIANGKDVRGKTVISLSTSFFDPNFEDYFKIIVRDLKADQLLLVVSGGNQGMKVAMNGRPMNKVFPHSLTTPDNSLMIVGGATFQGYFWESNTVGANNVPEHDVFALSVDNDFARVPLHFDMTKGPMEYVVKDGGTSVATATVSGLIAYFQSLDELSAMQPGGRWTPVAMKQFVKSLAHELHPPGQILDPGRKRPPHPDTWLPRRVPVVYNGAPDGVCEAVARGLAPPSGATQPPQEPLPDPLGLPSLLQPLEVVTQVDEEDRVWDWKDIFCGLCKRDGECVGTAPLSSAAQTPISTASSSARTTSSTEEPSSSVEEGITSEKSTMQSSSKVDPSSTSSTIVPLPSDILSNLNTLSWCNKREESCMHPVAGESDMHDMAKEFCKKLANEGPLTPLGNSSVIAYDIRRGDIGYHFTAQWATDQDGCIEENYKFPEGEECEKLVTQPYSTCRDRGDGDNGPNDGWGGRWQKRCAYIEYVPICEHSEKDMTCNGQSCNRGNRLNPDIELPALCGNLSKDGVMKPDSPRREVNFLWLRENSQDGDMYKRMSVYADWSKDCNETTEEDPGQGCEGFYREIFKKCDAGGDLPVRQSQGCLYRHALVEECVGPLAGYPWSGDDFIWCTNYDNCENTRIK